MTNEEIIKYLIPPVVTSTEPSVEYLKQKEAYDLAIKALEEQRPKGVWIHRRVIAKNRSFDMVVCSNCWEEFSWDAETGVCMDNYKICPNCGAEMRENNSIPQKYNPGINVSMEDIMDWLGALSNGGYTFTIPLEEEDDTSETKGEEE